MKKTMKTVAIALISMAMLAACDNNPVEPKPNEKEDVNLNADITTNRTLKSGNTYKLSGGVHVKNGAVLTIEPNVTIEAVDDDVVDYILIEQGAKIDAQGTATQPIVMTSERKEAGAWGGLHICGYAHTNAEGGTGKSEIGGASYGGNNDADNSGTLRYVRLEYTGFAFDEEHEANGISFYGVGNGTTVDYCQAYKGGDDGYEFFGGSVNIRHMVATDCADDSFDYTEGWNGHAQFLVAIQNSEATAGYEMDCLMECDNNGKNFAATPIAHPIVANITLVGNNSTTNKRGIRLRAGTQIEVYNAIVTGKANCITVETAETENALVNGTSKLEHIAMSSELSSKEGIYTNTLFAAAIGNSTNYVNTLNNKFVGTIAGGKDLAFDNFFIPASYKGAVPADNVWTAGWTK